MPRPIELTDFARLSAASATSVASAREAAAAHGPYSPPQTAPPRSLLRRPRSRVSLMSDPDEHSPAVPDDDVFADDGLDPFHEDTASTTNEPSVTGTATPGRLSRSSTQVSVRPHGVASEQSHPLAAPKRTATEAARQPDVGIIAEQLSRALRGTSVTRRFRSAAPFASNESTQLTATASSTISATSPSLLTHSTAPSDAPHTHTYESVIDGVGAPPPSLRSHAYTSGSSYASSPAMAASPNLMLRPNSQTYRDDSTLDVDDTTTHDGTTASSLIEPPSPLAPSISSTHHDTTPDQFHLQPEKREAIFRECLAAPEVDVDELRRIVWAYGVPDRPWARPLAWKLLLGLLPPEQSEWESTLAARRAEYWREVDIVSTNPSDVSATTNDHPLSTNPDSKWAEYFRDRSLRDLIEKDVARTHADLHRFVPLHEALRRILFVYAKRNTRTNTDGYRQGMNELAAPFLLVFSEAPYVDKSDAEADAYFCFRAIMDEMTTLYAVKETETVGIGRQLRELNALLRIKDPRLEAHLAQLSIEPRFYALRWMRVWLSMEFEIPDVLRLWDSFIATEIRLPWLRYTCVALLIRIREQLLEEDFNGCMHLLRKYPPCDVSEVLRVADRLRTANVTIVRTARR